MDPWMKRKVMAPEGAPAAAPAAAGGAPPAAMFGAPPPAAPPAAASTPPPAAAPPTPSTPLYPQGDWRNALPSELQTEASLKNMSDPSIMAQSYVSAQKMLGSDKISLPNEHASDADIQVFYDRLGRPKLDEYKVAVPKDAKFINEEWVKGLIPIAHKAGVMPKQMEKIIEGYEARVQADQAEQVKALTAKRAENATKMKEKWGQTYDQRVNWASRFVKEKGGEALLKVWNANNFGDHPEVVEFFAQMGESAYKEDTIKNEGSTGSSVFDPAEAMRRANEIIGNLEHPYHKPEHPNNKAAVKEVENLFAMAGSKGA